MGPQRPPGAKKKGFFQEMILDHRECQNKCFWCICRSWWPIVARLISQNALKMGCFATTNRAKMCFPKNDRKPFGMPKHVK